MISADGTGDVGVKSAETTTGGIEVRTASGGVSVERATSVSGAVSISAGGQGGVAADSLSNDSGSITVGSEDGDIVAQTVTSSSGNIVVNAGGTGDATVQTATTSTGAIELFAEGGNLTVGRATSDSGNVTLGALTIDDPIDELAGRIVTVRAAEGDIEIRKLTFETANLTAAEEGARLHVLSAIAQASRIVARADRIDLDSVTSTSTSTLFFDLAGNDGRLAMSTNVNALPGTGATAGVTTPGLIQFDRLFSTDATISGGIPNIRFMETLIGRQATFANFSNMYQAPFTVKLDNFLSTLSPGADALLASTAPFYLYFQDAKAFETNANVIYRNPDFRIQGTTGDVVNDTSLEQVLKRRTDPVAPAGRVTISIPGNVLGRNDGAIEGEDDLRITLPRRPSLGLRR